MIKTERQKTMDKVIKLAKELHSVARYSPDMKKCVEASVYQVIGNKELSQHCIALGITKQDYIEFILKNL